MNVTAPIGGLGNVGTPTTEPQGAAGEKHGIPSGGLHTLWWFGLGAVAAAGTLAATMGKNLVQRGKQVEPSLGQPFKKAEDTVSTLLTDTGTRLKEFGSTLGQQAQKAGSAIEEQMASVFERCQKPLRQEVQDLAKKVEELTQKIEKLQPTPSEQGPSES